MATDPLFTVTFDLTSSDDYVAFISGIRDRLGNPRHVCYKRPVLPPVEPGIPPRRWFHVVLKTPASSLTLATRADNLDLAGFCSGDGTWWELNHERRRGLMCVMRWPRGLIPGASSLGFGGTYRDLAGGAREAIDFTVGRQQMSQAVDALAGHTEDEKQKQELRAMDALVVLRYMVHEATRFLDVSAAVADLMCSPDAAATKSIKLTLKGCPDDLGWEWSSSLLLNAESLSGTRSRPAGSFIRDKAAWEIGDCLDKAVAKVGILLFVDTECGIKAKPALRLFSGDLSRRSGTDGAVQAKTDVTFLVSGESVAAHKYILAGKNVMFLRQLLYDIRSDKSPCVEVKGMEATIFKAMLHFIYTDEVPEFDQEQSDAEAMAVFAVHLHEAAHRYELDKLKLICKRKLQSGAISIGMAARTLALADRHNYRRLKAMCINFIVRTPDILHAGLATEGYKHLESYHSSVLTQLLKISVRAWEREIKS